MSTVLPAAVLSGLLAIPLLPGVPIGGTTPPGNDGEAAVAVSGSTSARDGVLRRGCRTYSYRYAVSAPYDDWTLETRVLDRSGRSVAAGTLIAPNDANTGRIRYTLCRRATKPGRFRIRGVLTAYDGTDKTEVRVPQSTFRLRRKP